MGICQKVRSLHCGLQAGLSIKKLDGRDVILFRDVPYELEHIVASWLVALPDDRREEFMYKDCALTANGWSAFVRWMIRILNNVIQAPDFTLNDEGNYDD